MRISENCDRPVFRYYGGKWRIAPQIIALMPKHEVYVEAFVFILGTYLHRFSPDTLPAFRVWLHERLQQERNSLP